MTTMFITEIKQGSDSFSEFRGRILYAVLKDNSDKLVCSATLEYILRAYFDKQSEIANYKEALIKYLDFNNTMIKHVSSEWESRLGGFILGDPIPMPDPGKFMDRVSFKYRNEKGEIVSVNLSDIVKYIGFECGIPSNILGLPEGELLDIEVDGEVVKGVLYLKDKTNAL